MIATILKALGIDPLSLLGKIFAVFLPFLPLFAMLGLLYGAYLYGVSHGNIVCDNSKLVATVRLKDNQIKDLKDQNEKYLKSIRELRKNNAKLDSDLEDAQEKLETVVLGGEKCDQGKALVDTLNNLR